MRETEKNGQQAIPTKLRYGGCEASRQSVFNTLRLSVHQTLSDCSTSPLPNPPSRVAVSTARPEQSIAQWSVPEGGGQIDRRVTSDDLPASFSLMPAFISPRSSQLLGPAAVISLEHRHADENGMRGVVCFLLLLLLITVLTVFVFLSFLTL